MRKKALKKKYPNRHQIILSLRQGNNLKEMITSNGKTIYMNMMKHMLYQKPYKHWELMSEMNRFGNNFMKKLMAQKEMEAENSGS